MIDLVGKKINRLTVISRDVNDKRGQLRWLCKCDCGNEKIVIGNNLKRGHTKSCGCFAIERAVETNTKHGQGGSKEFKPTSEYTTWKNILSRCYKENNIVYKYYGGRGVKVCDRWLSSFENFFSDMGKKPTPKHSIDRINVNGNYEPDNCRWATQKVQAGNTRSNKWIEYNGLKMIKVDWEDFLGIKRGKLYRYLKSGKSFKIIYEFFMNIKNGGTRTRFLVKLTGENNPLSKKVYCITNDTVYSSTREAAEKLNCVQSSVSQVCNKKRNHTKNYVFKYI
jgi:hypothetical protein